MPNELYLVAGLGKTGYSIAHYLKKRHIPFVLYDTRKIVADSDKFEKDFDVPLYLGEFPSNLFKQLHAVISSPGVPLNDPVMTKAQTMRIPIWGDIECFAREVKAPIVAITGTNGKSTVTTLVGEMAKASGIEVAVAGNIGEPVLTRFDEKDDYALWVIELSSFQLDLVSSLKPQAASVLNISPDHLDRHPSMEAYIAAKLKIYQNAAHLIYNREDANTIPSPISSKKAISVSSFGLNSAHEGTWGILETPSGLYLSYGKEPVLATDSLALKGQHNWQNALAAMALAKACAIPFESMNRVLTTFTGLPHRSQLVRMHQGVQWINDSKGTNIGATISAVNGIGQTLSGKIVLIAGGLGKGADFNLLNDSLKTYVSTVVLIGQDAPKIEAALKGLVPTIKAHSMSEAVCTASKVAKEGDVVLLSPACASQDMFKDFNHRGEMFIQEVNAL